MIDSADRMAIREFQKDNNLTVTGSIDHEIERSDSMEGNSPRSCLAD